MKKLVLILAVCLLLCTVPAASLPVAVRADDDFFEVGQTWDTSILAGGIFDMYAWVGDNADDYTYQWQVDLGFGTGNWSDLEDNANPYGYSGTQTYHMQLITPRTNGYIIGTGWEDIPFQCVVTNKKTGVSMTTASIFMYVFTSDDLPEYLEKQGFGLYEPSAEGATQLRTTDYSNYTASAQAGTQLEFFCGCWRPGGEHLLRQSDFTENVEIWITENGKTVKKDNITTYIPCTIGKDAVTVQYKLRHALGIHDLGYYEVKTLKISTTEPDIVGRGTAKQEMSLLREPYGQSQKLITIPKGQLVNVHTNSGSWYQVSYNGYVGYVAGSALNYEDYNPTISHVDVKIAEPLAGNIPATSCTITPNTCFATSVEWMDKTEDRFMNPGERFVKGHTYQLVIWASAKEDYWFKLDPNDKMLTTATINGCWPAFTYRAYEQVIGKVIDIRFDFVNVQEQPQHECGPVYVSRVEPTCTQPGHEAYFHCVCGKNYQDTQGKNPVNIAQWGVIPATGHTPSQWRTTQVYHYKACTTCGELLGEEDHIPGPEATEAQPQKCTVCDYIITPVKNHTHSLTLVEQVPATCTQSGTKAYYVCSGCSDRFADKAGKVVISDSVEITIGVLGHSTAEDWRIDGQYHWRYCPVCSTALIETKMYHEYEDDVCTTCGYEQGTQIATEPPAEPLEESDTEPAEPQVTDPTQQEKSGKLPAVVIKIAVAALLVLLFAVCFSGALLVTILILKKKRGEKQ